jgi:hypothetical protein
VRGFFFSDLAIGGPAFLQMLPARRVSAVRCFRGSPIREFEGSARLLEDAYALWEERSIPKNPTWRYLAQ